jgi:hypothetical protein
MIYGIDASTAIIGMAQFQNDGTFVRADHVDLRGIDGLLAKADEFHGWLVGTTPRRGLYGDDENWIFVEERLMGFAAGRTSQQVMMKLAQFNAMVSYILWTYEPGHHRSVVHIHPSSWKATLKWEGLLIPKGTDKKKQITLEFVRHREPDFDETVVMMGLNRNGNPQPWCYDMADAWCLGRAGYLKCIVKGNSQP